MTIRVYKLDSAGRVTWDSGTRTISSSGEEVPARSAYPPCECPRHRRLAAAVAGAVER